jgi:hypothetical protein
MIEHRSLPSSIGFAEAPHLRGLIRFDVSRWWRHFASGRSFC